MALPRSIMEMAVSSAKSGTDYGDIVKGHVPSGGYAPKSWFADPFEMLDQVGLGYRASPNSLSFDTLTQMAEKNVVVAAIHQTRIAQVSAFCQPQANKYSVGFKINHKNPYKKLSQSEKEYVHNLQRFLLQTGVERERGRDNFDTLIKKLVRDRLTFDQTCMEKVPRRDGRPHAVYAVSGESIRIANPKKKKSTPMEGRDAEDRAAYVQIVDGRQINTYTQRELAFGVANPRTNLSVHGYGFSELEMLIQTITSHLWAEEWNRKAFSQGSTLKGLINFQGNLPSQQLDAFKRQWATQLSGVSNSWRTPILNTEGVQWVPLQPNNNEMGYQGWLEYLIKIACAVYLIDPAEINFDLRGGGGMQAPMFMTTNEAQQKVSKDRGLQPLLRFFQNYINNHIIEELDEDFEFAFVGIDAKTEEQAIELRLKELGSYKTLNEIRAEAEDLAPVPYGETVMNPTYVGYMNQQKQQEQMAAQQAAQGAGGDPNAPGGAPGSPPGAPPSPVPSQMSPGAPGAQKMLPAGQQPNEGALSQMFAGAAHETTEKDAADKLRRKVSAVVSRPGIDEDDKESWEVDIHASAKNRPLSVLTMELSKALNAFDEFDQPEDW